MRLFTYQHSSGKQAMLCMGVECTQAVMRTEPSVNQCVALRLSQCSHTYHPMPDTPVSQRCGQYTS